MARSTILKKLFPVSAIAIAASIVLASGSALAGDEEKAILATGLTFCEVGNAAVFPAVNVGHETVDVAVACTNQSGEGFSPEVKKATLKPGESEIELKLACVNFEGLDVGGELVRCTVKGDEDDLAQVRGVLHICAAAEAGEDLALGDCGLTEALLTEVESEDDDDKDKDKDRDKRRRRSWYRR